MSTAPAPARFMFAGHAIGAAARFNRLDDLKNLNHVIPALATSVVPETGGIATQEVKDFCFNVAEPRKRCLLSVKRAITTVEGRDPNGSFETELTAELEDLQVVEKLRIENLRLHMLAVRNGFAGDVTVSTVGNRIDGVYLGKVKAEIVLDDHPLRATGSDQQLAKFYSQQSDSYRSENCARFRSAPGSTVLAKQGEHYCFSLVKSIKLIGEEADKAPMEVNGNVIYWHGFGRIILGEVHVKGHERKVSLVRLAMGSDAGGDGTAGSGTSNGGGTTG